MDSPNIRASRTARRTGPRAASFQGHQFGVLGSLSQLTHQDQDSSSSVSSSPSSHRSERPRTPNAATNASFVASVTLDPQGNHHQVPLERLRAIAQEAHQMQQEVDSFMPENGDDAYADEDSDDGGADGEIGPVFQSWVDRSTASEDFVKKFTNFTLTEFRSLWEETSHIITSSWNVGSGNRSKIHPMDAFLMAITHCKMGDGYFK